MDSRSGPGRARSLVLELAARTAIVDGQRVELPPTEFSLLAVLGARPGEVVPHKELLHEAFGDSAYMDVQDLHWRIWKIRQLIGDTDKTIIRNRRGLGFVLEQGNVQVVKEAAEAPTESETQVIRLDDEPPDRQRRKPHVTRSASVADEPPDRRFVLSPVALVVLGLVAGLALAGSWIAGYTLSQRGKPPTAADPPASASQEARDQEERRPSTPRRDKNRQQRTNGKKESSQDRGGGHSFAIGPSGANESAATTRTSATAPSSSPVHQSSGSRPKVDSGPQPQPAPPPPPPPQPNAQLYHLHNADTGDHIMTTSSSVANQKQAAGYTSTPAGGVFTSQENGTVAIGLDGGTAYVYASPSSAPEDLRVTALYRLSSGGDFFYTTSSSAANQAQAQGWSRSMGGYVAT